MRQYIVRHLLGIGAAAVGVVVLSWSWPVRDGVAQADGAADDAILTVGRCIEANASVVPLEDALIKEDIIEEDLLQTKVTNGMCKDMLEGITDATPVRKLAAAQNYIQEINLIEGAMDEAAGVAAAKGTDRYSSSDESFILFRTIAQTDEEIAAQEQYPQPESAAPSNGAGEVRPSNGAGGLEPRKVQAAAAASVGEDEDASIAERLQQKEAALKREGASAPEARAGALCDTEVAVLDDKVKKIKGFYEIVPQIPEEIQRGEPEEAGLLVLPSTRKRFQEIRQKHKDIDEESKSNIGCVELTDRMKAKLVTLDLERAIISRHHPDDIQELSSNRATRWGWGINARQTGNLELILDLSYAISRGGQEFRLAPQSPVSDKTIRLTPPQSTSSPEPTERPWWQRTVFGRILERIFGA